MNFKILLLNILMLLDVLISGHRFNYFMVEGKKEFVKKSCFVQSWAIFSEFWAKYLEFDEGTN